MRKIILFIGLCFTTIIASAQPEITGNHLKLEKKNGVTVIIFDSITSDTKIDYKGTNVKIFKYNDLTETFLFPPVDATGYIIEDDGIPSDTIYVIDYSNYSPILNSLEPEDNNKIQCDEVKLNLSCYVPELSYIDAYGTRYFLQREFTVSYKTQKWTDKWNETDTIETVFLPTTEFTVQAPLCDTYFTLSGDQFARELNIPISIKSHIYSVVAVKCHPTSIVTIREGLNEAERPSDVKQITGSAPLDIQFLSNANKPEALTYVWSIYKGEQFVIGRTEKDHRYTFTEAGTFKVKLETKNAYCSDSGIITITVTESALYVPNIFTPNGDLINDEFRIAYKSIISFQCWVYNRWGRKVFYWTDPQKGWDGNINGKKAAAGAYFYVINAVGSDGIKYKRKGDINLLRGKE